MKGVVEKLCDIDSIAIPEELLECNVDEQQIEAAVQSLSVRYAKEEPSEQVSKGDFVSCQADKESYPDGRTILLYPGMNMPGAEDAEAAVLGKKAEDVVSTSIAGKSVTLTIKKIAHRIPAQVTDELIAGIGLEGVSTIAQYKEHVRAKMLEDQKMEKGKEIVRYFMDKLTNESTYKYDQAEMEAYIQSMMAQYTQEAEEMGENISPEEIRQGIIYQSKQAWMTEGFCKAKEIEVDLSSIEEETDKMIEMMELMGEAVPDRAQMTEMAVQDAYFSGFMSYLDKVIGEKTGGSYGNC